MKFGKVAANLAEIDFSLPRDTPQTEALLQSLAKRHQEPVIYIGASVWADRSFIGKIYPKGTKAKDFLKIYAQQFNTVELNTTFYSIPSVEKVKNWKEAVTPDFKFCPKFPRRVSHRENMEAHLLLFNTFIESIIHFEEKLGMSFLQLPPYFKPTKIKVLEKFLHYMPEDFPLAIELRHPDWFSNPVVQHEIFDFFKQKGITAVITDVAGRRDVLHQTLTTNCAFIRFTGNNLHFTDFSRIDAWVKRIAYWLEKGLKKVYFLLHEAEKGLCADLATYMIEHLNQLLTIQLSPPQLYSEHQQSFF